jgi:hypothetical protein
MQARARVPVAPSHFPGVRSALSYSWFRWYCIRKCLLPLGLKLAGPLRNPCRGMLSRDLFESPNDAPPRKSSPANGQGQGQDVARGPRARNDDVQVPTSLTTTKRRHLALLTYIHMRHIPTRQRVSTYLHSNLPASQLQYIRRADTAWMIITFTSLSYIPYIEISLLPHTSNITWFLSCTGPILSVSRHLSTEGGKHVPSPALVRARRGALAEWSIIRRRIHGIPLCLCETTTNLPINLMARAPLAWGRMDFFPLGPPRFCNTLLFSFPPHIPNMRPASHCHRHHYGGNAS